MKKTLTAIGFTAAVLLTSCTYLQKVDNEATALRFSEEKIRCNYAQVKISPDNDKVFYIAKCVTMKEYDSVAINKGEHYLMQSFIDDSRTAYNRWRGEAFRNDAKYIAGLEDIMFYYAGNTHTFTRLEPNTQYIVLAFCVNSQKMIPMGELHKLIFTTPGADIAPSKMEFDFMFRKVGGTYYGYVKPTENGKICHEPYLADFAEFDDLQQNFGGNLSEYIRYWMPVYKEFMRYYSKFDISRSVQGYFDGLVPGKKYVMFAFPYTMDYEDHIGTLTFEFKDDMYIPYSHDENELHTSD